MSAEQNDINNKKLEDFISNLGSAVSSSLVSGSTAAADGKNPQKATAGRSVSRLEILAAVARFWVPHIPLVSMATLEYYSKKQNRTISAERGKGSRNAPI